MQEVRTAIQARTNGPDVVTLAVRRDGLSAPEAAMNKKLDPGLRSKLRARSRSKAAPASSDQPAGAASERIGIIVEFSGDMSSTFSALRRMLDQAVLLESNGGKGLQAAGVSRGQGSWAADITEGAGAH